MSQLQQNRLPEHFYDEPFALCFSGQGFDWISSLREALAEGARGRANEVAAAAARILAPVAGQIATARRVSSRSNGRKTARTASIWCVPP